MIDFLNRLYALMAPMWTVSLAGAWAAAIVLLLRLVLKNRVPRQVLCLLWLVVFARLALPFSFQSPVSLVPSPVTEDIPARVERFTGRIDPLPQGGQTGLTPDQLVQPGQTGPQTQTGQTVPQTQTGVTAPSAPAPRQFPLRAVMAGAWLAGLAAMLGYALFSYLRLKLKLFDAIRTKYGAWEHPYVGSPFILGMLCPRIYIPVGVTGDTRRFILCHERAHLDRGDHIVKPLCWLILAVHWFNPAAWIAFLLLSRDMEAACDERVLRVLGEDVKADYSSALLSLATAGRFPGPSPLAFDEGDAGSRIKNVLRYHRPAVAAIIVGVMAVVIAAACLLTSPVRAGQPEDAAPTTDLSDILDEDQLAVYQQAEELYLRLFGGENSEINTAAGDDSSFTQGNITYLAAAGEYADWSVFDAAVRARFTARFWAERNSFGDANSPIFTEHDGRTYYLDASLADRLLPDDAPSIYTLVSKTDDAVEFTITDRFYPDEGGACTLVFSVRMARTAAGWRVDEMRSPKSALDREQARRTQVTALDSGEDGLYHQFRLTHGGRSVTFSGSAESGWGPDNVAETASAVLSDSASGGQKQALAVVFRTAHGTGLLEEELHLFDPDTLEKYDCSGVVDEALGRLGSYSDDENYYITVSGEPLAAVPRTQTASLFFGDYCHFEARDGQLYLVIAAGYVGEPEFFGDVRVRLGLDDLRAVCLDYAYTPYDAPDPETQPKEYLLDLLNRGFASGGWQGWYFILPATGPLVDPALEAEPLKALFSSLEWTYQGTEDDIGPLSNYSLRWDGGDHPVRVDFSEGDALLSVTVHEGYADFTRLLFRAEGIGDLSASFLALCQDPWLDFGRVTVPFGEDAEATARRFLREALALYRQEGNATEFEAAADNIQEQEGGDILYDASIALKPADPDREFWRGKLDGDGWYRLTSTVCLTSDPYGGDFYVIGWFE